MGMWGADDPSGRKPLIWPDYNFEEETTHPLKMSRPADKVTFDHDLFAWYRKLISIRKENKVLMTGDLEFELPAGQKELLCYRRYDEETELLIVLNNSTEERSMEVESSMTDLLNGKTYRTSDGISKILLEPRSAAILKPFQ